MRFSLIPREEHFFDMFDEFSGKLTRASSKFLEMITVFDHLEKRGKELKNQEEACDLVIERIITALDRTFITPFDREDIYALAKSFDNIMDNLEETAYRLEELRIQRPPADAIELARITHECCARLESATRLLRDMGNSEQIHTLLKEITRLENDADRVYRKADAAMFASLVTSNGVIDKTTGLSATPITALDILTLIKSRELYSRLEATVDACKEVGNVILGIVIKGT